MFKKNTYKTGLDAEEMIAKHYIDDGFKISHKRFKTKYGEIDIVAQKNNLVVFIEVKARNKPLHLELLSEKQISRNCNAALMYIAKIENTNENYNYRFDYAEVINGSISQIIENAWQCN